MSDFEKTLINAMARRCGLQSPDEFARETAVMESIEVADPAEPWRTVMAQRVVSMQGTGRTTRMLLQAMALTDGGMRVEVMTLDQGQATGLYGRMAELMEAVAEHSGRGMIRFVWPDCELDPKAPAADLRLVDHAVTEAENFERAKRAARREEPTGGQGSEATESQGEVSPKAVTVEDWETLLRRVQALETVVRVPSGEVDWHEALVNLEGRVGALESKDVDAMGALVAEPADVMIEPDDDTSPEVVVLWNGHRVPEPLLGILSAAHPMIGGEITMNGAPAKISTNEHGYVRVECLPSWDREQAKD